MSETIIENISERKLTVLVSFLLLCQVTCFLLGGFIAPIPTSSETVSATVCKDTDNNTNRWFYGRGNGNCRDTDVLSEDNVFTFQMPLPQGGHIVKYSRWMQNYKGFFRLDLTWPVTRQSRNFVTIDARVAYRNKGDADDAWKLYAQTLEMVTRHNEHTVEPVLIVEIPLFQFGSLHHDFYLINVRLPVVNSDTNPLVGLFHDVWFTGTRQCELFTKLMISLKTAFSSIIMAATLWFWRRVLKLERKFVLLEKMLLGLGFTLFLLNLPFEFLTLHYDLPFMQLLNDIRQRLFYVILFAFWLIFVGEHIIIKEESSLKQYWREVSVFVIVCAPFFAFNMWKCVMLLRNPFYVIETNLELTFFYLEDIFAGVYFLFLSYMIWKAFCNIAETRASLYINRSIHSPQLEKIGTNVSIDSMEMIDNRFKIVMLLTLLCTAITVIYIVLGNIIHTKFNEELGDNRKKTSAFLFSVYGMWNIYISALMVLYAPSDINNVTEIVFTANLGEEFEIRTDLTEGQPQNHR